MNVTLRLDYPKPNGSKNFNQVKIFTVRKNFIHTDSHNVFHDVPLHLYSLPYIQSYVGSEDRWVCNEYRIEFFARVVTVHIYLISLTASSLQLNLRCTNIFIHIMSSYTIITNNLL